jgi:superfamily II DNA or RNA helicase
MTPELDFERRSVDDLANTVGGLNPREIFNALPKPPGINDLYAS